VPGRAKMRRKLRRHKDAEEDAETTKEEEGENHRGHREHGETEWRNEESRILPLHSRSR
jgi:hypothetical protein